MTFADAYLFANILSVVLLVGLVIYMIIRLAVMKARPSFEESVIMLVIGLLVIYSKLTAIGIVTDQFMR